MEEEVKPAVEEVKKPVTLAELGLLKIEMRYIYTSYQYDVRDNKLMI